jgi:hypothetical protein
LKNELTNDTLDPNIAKEIEKQFVVLIEKRKTIIQENKNLKLKKIIVQAKQYTRKLSIPQNRKKIINMYDAPAQSLFNTCITIKKKIQ